MADLTDEERLRLELLLAGDDTTLVSSSIVRRLLEEIRRHRENSALALSSEERETAITLRATMAEFGFLPEIPRVLALLDRLLGATPC